MEIDKILSLCYVRARARARAHNGKSIYKIYIGEKWRKDERWRERRENHGCLLTQTQYENLPAEWLLPVTEEKEAFRT